MSRRPSTSRVGFELGTSSAPARAKPREDTPFCIGILGDFSGRENRGIREVGPALAARRPVPVDVDNLDGLPARLAAEIHVPIGGPDGPRTAITFAELDDFHPDRLFARLELFRGLKGLRQRLANPATFAAAAEEVRSWLGAPPAGGQTPPPQPLPGATAKGEGPSEAQTLERLLGQRPAETPARGLGKVEELIREAVRPYIVPAPHPLQGQIVADLDRAISGQMRAVLHSPAFQALEAAWRGLQFLVSQAETDETLQIFLVDVSKAELAADLSGGDLAAAGMYRLLVEQGPSRQADLPWGLLVGCYRFGPTRDDAELLGRLAGVARLCAAPLLAEADSRLAGCASFGSAPDPDDWTWQAEADAAKAWQELRSSPVAASVGLVLPRLLLRLPYGKETEPLESFDFEEQPLPPEHEGYLWGNPAWLPACLMAAAFREGGWDLSGSLGQEMIALPMHVYSSGGENRVTPPAEAFLTERAAQVLIGKGLIPLLSMKGRDSVRLATFQSIASPAAPLAGRWQ